MQFEVSDDAMAQQATGVKLRSGVSLLTPLIERAGVVSSATLARQTYSLPEYNYTEAKAALSLKYEVGGTRSELTAFAKRKVENSGLEDTLGYTLSTTLAPKPNLHLTFSTSQQIVDADNNLDDRIGTSATIGRSYQPAKNGMVFRGAFSSSDIDYNSTFSDISSLSAEVGASHQVTDCLHLDASLSQSHLMGWNEHFFYGSKRDDTISQVGITITPTKMGTPFGKPYNEVTRTKTDSNWRGRSYSKTGVAIGVSQSF